MARSAQERETRRPIAKRLLAGRGQAKRVNRAAIAWWREARLTGPSRGVYRVELRAERISRRAPEGIGVSGVRLEPVGA